MWSYYGAKTNVVDFYPPPRMDKIIEPFAGTARYALRYFEKDILLVDKYKLIIDIWKWLQLCSPNDIMKLPNMAYGDHVDNFDFDCIEAKHLMGFLIGFMTESPRKTATIRLLQRPNHLNYAKKRIASNLFKIKHWEFRCDTYCNIKNENASWFIDPPYQNGGHIYKEHDIDYNHLKEWAKSRMGQIIICEKEGADWMDFKYLKSHKTRNGFQKEVIWSNYPTSADNIQKTLF